jgi:hypothetical protein
VATQRFYAAGAPLSSGSARALYGLAVAAVVIGAALSLPARDLWEPDEARIAQVAREVVDSGDWLVPRLLGEPYTQKPPLYIAVALRLAGLLWKSRPAASLARAARSCPGAAPREHAFGADVDDWAARCWPRCRHHGDGPGPGWISR